MSKEQHDDTNSEIPSRASAFMRARTKIVTDRLAKSLRSYPICGCNHRFCSHCRRDAERNAALEAYAKL
jgi:hypothetical protein